MAISLAELGSWVSASWTGGLLAAWLLMRVVGDSASWGLDRWVLELWLSIRARRS